MTVALLSAGAEAESAVPTLSRTQFALQLRKNYWTSGFIYLGLCLLMSVIARRWFDVDASYSASIWNPNAGLSLLLLLCGGLALAPFSFVGAVLCDAIVYGLPFAPYSTVPSALVVTLGYVAIVFITTWKGQFDLARVRLNDVVVLLVVCPVGFAIMSLLHSVVLQLTGVLPFHQLGRSTWYFWIGETVGAIILIPVATSIFLFAARSRPRIGRPELIDSIVFILGSFLGCSAIFSEGGVGQHQFFYLLFLPIVWIGLRRGYSGVAIALLFIHLASGFFAAFLSYTPQEFAKIEVLVLALAVTGLPLGASITERRLIAAALHQQRTESARASAQAMGMALAHEISQPLSASATYIHVASQMLQLTVSRSVLADVLRKAESEAHRTREILERLRDFVSTGKLELKWVDISKLVIKTVALCEENATALGIDLRVPAVRGGLNPPLVRVDEIQMERVLTNLICNAIDAVSKQRRSGGMITVWITHDDKRVAINVEDNGCGIKPEMASRIFEPYQTTKPKGMGLGLSLSRHILEQHSGTLRWEPLKPEGTRFVLELGIDGPNQHGLPP